MSTKKLKSIKISFGRKSYKLSMTKKFQLILGAGLLTLLLLTGIFLILRSANAGSATLYPGNCLGSWQNPNKAQGRPEAQSSQFITKENSAVFSEGGIKEIYCGSFNGNFSESEIKLIKSVTLKFSWLVSDKELKAATSSITIIQPPATSSEEIAKDTNYIVNQVLNNIHADEVHLIVSTTTSEIMITANTSIIKTATSTVPETQTSSVSKTTATSSVSGIKLTENTAAIATSSSTSFWWKKFGFFFANDQVSNASISKIAPVATSPVSSVGAATSTLDNPIAPDDDFLKISYTLDGINWQTLGTVNKSNWQNLSFNIPVYKLEDVKKIQIKIESLPLVNKTPFVYLDGMSLQVEYDIDNSNNLGAAILGSFYNQQGGRTDHFVSKFYNRNPNSSTISSPLNVNLNYNNISELNPGCQSQAATQWHIYVEACGDSYSWQPTINGAPTCLGGQDFLSQNFSLNQKSISANITLPLGNYNIVGYVCLDNAGNELGGDNVESQHQEGFLTPIFKIIP